MDKKIKDYIAEKKLSDDDIYKLLTAETQSADKESEEHDQEEQDADNDSADGQEEDQESEEDADSNEQPDMRSMIKEILAEELSAMKGGRKAPKVKKTIKKKPPTKPIWKEFGSL